MLKTVMMKLPPEKLQMFKRLGALFHCLINHSCSAIICRLVYHQPYSQRMFPLGRLVAKAFECNLMSLPLNQTCALLALGTEISTTVIITLCQVIVL